MKKENESRTTFATMSQTAKVTITMFDKNLVEMEKALNEWVENMNRKRVRTDGNVLSQKVLSLYEDFSKHPLKRMTTFTEILLQYIVIMVLFLLLLIFFFRKKSTFFNVQKCMSKNKSKLNIIT